MPLPTCQRVNHLLRHNPLYSKETKHKRPTISCKDSVKVGDQPIPHPSYTCSTNPLLPYSYILNLFIPRSFPKAATYVKKGRKKKGCFSPPNTLARKDTGTPICNTIKRLHLKILIFVGVREI